MKIKIIPKIVELILHAVKKSIHFAYLFLSEQICFISYVYQKHFLLWSPASSLFESCCLQTGKGVVPKRSAMIFGKGNKNKDFRE